ncbi:MAG: hypothetical protein H7Z41_09865 [Cytophagales bacterium]|nr:hypothetical protein [Armatimonadota bacterium]
MAAVFAGIPLGMAPMLTSVRSIQGACFWYIGLFAIGQITAVHASDRFLKPSRAGIIRDPTQRQRFNGSLLLIAMLIVAGYLALLRVLPVHAISSELPFYTSYTVQAMKDTLIGALVACFLLYCAQSTVAAKQGVARRPLAQQFLESPLVRFTGLISYSLYLTHCIVMGILPTVERGLFLSPTGLFVFRLLVATPVCLGLAYAFYLCFERPYLVRRAAASAGRGETPGSQREGVVNAGAAVPPPNTWTRGGSNRSSVEQKHI